MCDKTEQRPKLSNGTGVWYYKQKQGLTLVELLFTIAIFVAIAFISGGVFSNLLQGKALEDATLEAQSILDGTRSRTLASEDALSYGVHISEDALTVFIGPTYDELESSNRIYSFPRGVSVATTSLSGGSEDILFAHLTGSTTAYGTFVLATSNGSTTLRVYQTGIVDIE